MEDYKKYKQIFSLKLAGYLMMNGFPIKRIHHNLKVKNKDVYLFEDTKELVEFMLKYKNMTTDKEGIKYGDNKRNS